MKKKPEERSEEMPFSFLKKTVSEDKIAAHWKKIATKLAGKSTADETEEDVKAPNKNMPSSPKK